MSRLLLSTEVSQVLGVSSASVKRWADDGRLPCVLTPGRHRRFDSEEVERFQETQTRLTGHAAGWANRLLSQHGAAGLHGALLEERSRCGSWWLVAHQLELVGTELTGRVAAGGITSVQALIAGERLLCALQQCTTGVPRTGAPRLLLVQPEVDHARLDPALVDLCARELGWATQIVGSVAEVEVRRHLENTAPSPSAVVMTATPLGSDEAHGVTAYASATRADCARLGIAFAFVGDSSWASAEELTAADLGMAGLRSWLQAIESAQAAAPLPSPAR
jgi:excisionase family DNA binding protein